MSGEGGEISAPRELARTQRGVESYVDTDPAGADT
jgi:hypothetical protein